MTTSMAQPLWEGEHPEEPLALRYGLAATYERDATARALQWARARPNRWREVLYTRRSNGPVGTARAAVKLYDADRRQREDYVQQLLERGRRRDG